VSDCSDLSQGPWPQLAMTCMRVALEEIATPTALAAAVDEIERASGAACAIAPRGAPVVTSPRGERANGVETPSASFPLRSSDGRDVGTLVFYGPHELSANALDRLTRVCALLFANGEPSDATLKLVHRLNNKLAALLANIELIDAILAEASPEAPLLASATREKRADLLCAVRLAHGATLALVEIASRTRAILP
jgi:hypothetical protein